MPTRGLRQQNIGERFAHLLSSGHIHAVAGILTVIAVLFSGYDAIRTRPSDGTIWRVGQSLVEVAKLVDASPAVTTPLRPGDIIVGIGQLIVSSPQSAAAELRRYGPPTTIPYLIRRDGHQITVSVPLSSTRVDLGDYAINVALALIYLFIGFAVYRRSDNDRATSLFFVLCLMFALYFMTNLQQTSYFLGVMVAQNIGAFARFMLPAVFLHFFLVFPRRKLALIRRPWLVPVLYIIPLLMNVHFFVEPSIHPTSWLILGVYYVLGLGALLHGYFSYRDPLMRQRVRILTFGTLGAVIPFLVIKIGLEELNSHTGLTRLGAIPLVAIPLSFGYCVARHQVLQIDLILRRNLAYGLLTGLVWSGYLGAVWAFGTKLLTLLATENSLIAAGTTLAVAGILWPLRLRLQRDVDYRFYHSRDNMAALIEDFSREIPRLIQKETLLQRVGEKLVMVLGLPGLAMYLAGRDQTATTFELVGSFTGKAPQPALDTQSRPANRPLTLPIHYPERLDLAGLSQTMESQGEPLWVDASGSEHLADHPAVTKEQTELLTRLKEQQFLLRHNLQLLIPMVAQGRLVGIIALPNYPGEEEYQVHELQLMTIVAGQVALQVENARLYEEEVAKEKLEEEMAMARRIQSRLLPRSLPQYPGVEIEAINVSSKQVSGDYYDMFERPDGKLALVIADVCGKGVPASLLASNIQAALRGLCYSCDPPGVVLERLNLQLHASTDPEHFATLFLAVLDTQNRTLEYSSGGHNAPVVLRHDGQLILLQEGGLPLGAFDFGSYDEGHIRLDPGDLLFLYTDGLTETKDPLGEDEFGEERLNALLLSHHHGPVSDLFDTVNAELLAYSQRPAEVHADDDITMIGLKIALDDDQAATTTAAERRA